MTHNTKPTQELQQELSRSVAQLHAQERIACASDMGHRAGIDSDLIERVQALQDELYRRGELLMADAAVAS